MPVKISEAPQTTRMPVQCVDCPDWDSPDRDLSRLYAYEIAAQDRERKRLARELHDGIGQILAGVKFKLESLPGKIALNGRAKEEIHRVSGILDRAISEIRRVSHNLIPLELEDLGLEQALLAFCREFQERLGVQVTLLTGHVPAAVPPELALALFRIAQEALNNAGKHSRATMVAVVLSRKGTEIVLSVTDNGIGFSFGGNRPPTGRGIGLGNMRERAESIGGHIELHSTPGSGTKVSVHACVFRTKPRQRSGPIPATVPEQTPPAFRTNVRHPSGVTPPSRDRTKAGEFGAIRPS